MGKVYYDDEIIVDPGAKIYEKANRESISLRYVDKDSIVLENGDRVHRHMMDGDAVLFNRQPDWVIYHELVVTTKEYMRKVTHIDPKWLVELVGSFFGLSHPTKRKGT